MSKQTEWRRTTLGEALPIRYGKARTDKAGVVREETPVYGSSGLIDKFDRALTNGPTLIIGRKGTVGATHYCSEPCWPIDTVYFVEGSEGKDLRFFKYLLDYLQLGRMDRSTAVPGLSRDDYNAKEVAIPDGDEQHRIVAEIEKQFTRLDAGIASLKRVQAALKRHRASVLKSACEGAWPRTTVAKVATDVRYGTSAKTTEGPSGVPVIRMGNIIDGRLSLEKLKFLPNSHREFPDLLLKSGDLLFNRTNSAELVGKTAVYHGTPEPCSFASYLIRVRVNPEYSPDFLSYYLNSAHGRKWIASVVSQQVGQANVNGTKLKALEIPNPPLADQTRIVAEVERRLSVVEELDAVVSANLQRATRLRQSILQKAFSGAL